MTSGLGGTHPFGLALAARRRGFRAEVCVNTDQPLFIDGVRTENKKKIMGLTHEAMAALMLYDWPGNIRELEHAIEHAFLLCKEELIGLRHLPDKLLTEINAAFANNPRTLKDIEKNAILHALRRNNWKKLVTARELGINKNTLRRKIVTYGIEGKGSGTTYDEKNRTIGKKSADRSGPGRCFPV